jgi:ankyrin repeat protein
MRFLLGICFTFAIFLVVVSGCHKKPEDAAEKDKNGTLMVASARGDLSRVQRLLREGAQVNQRNSDGQAAIHSAAQSKNVLVVEALIQAGADVNARSVGNVTPSMLSLDMAFGEPDISLALIRAGADVNVADENGDTALIIATTESSSEVFQALLDRGANPNARGQQGETALHYAAMNAILDRAKLLLEHGADASIRNSAGKAPFDVAYTTNPDKLIQAKFQDMRNLLLDATPQKRKPMLTPD